MLCVELPTFKPLDNFTRVIRPPMWETVKHNMDRFVLEMHCKSGLIAAIDTEDEPLALIEGEAVSTLQRWTKGVKGPMGGANPSFDRSWLFAHMPKLATRFHYRNFDVRTLTFLQELGGKPFQESAHRALADCYQANAVVREFLGIS
jgi:oligoribonuclease